ncbi:hypothetical protein SAMN02745126_03758 [Enhydrobacter aerosaccus]|uniref:Uncharacterized protein n=1 Tax=Enhydrobacter aerosaccus TaxID=225324 RepID=A0A1T4RC62_9HYPH|nr:SrfA family protein [Enhydrobacter aerosaccus]SKA13406.1 hypothetical protein SAMN02745126_03758 [Enhydrobacter aerosaccus]
MTGPLLSSEPLQRYRALGLGGDPVWRAAQQLRAAIGQRLSREHADLLAIPEADPSGRRIDWYAAHDGDVRRLADLGGNERATVLEKVRRLHADLASLADSMVAPGRSGAERNFARLLRLALTAPGEETLYVVDGRPIMTFWGFSADAALPGVFLASPPAPSTPARPMSERPVSDAVLATAPAAAVASTPARSLWWQWVLLAALLLLLLAALAWVVRPYLPHIEPRLEADARDRALTMSVRAPAALQQARMDTLQKENEDLRLELARLTDEVAQRGANCSAGVLGPGGAIIGVIPGAPIERGAAPDGANGVDVTNKDEANKNGTKSPDDKNTAGAPDKSPNGPDKGQNGPDKDKQAADKKDEPKPMVVPPEAKQKQDLAFLRGDWRSRTGLATPQGEKDLRPAYTLDDKGKGKVNFVQQNGATCEAPAEARWDNGKLVIEEKSNPKCTDGRTYARNIVNCEVGQDGVAQCKGSQPGDSRTYNVQFGR